MNKSKNVNWPINPEIVKQVDREREEAFDTMKNMKDDLWDKKIEEYYVKKTDEYFEQFNKGGGENDIK